MASPSRPEIPNNFRFEFDPANKLLLVRVGGRLTEEVVTELYKAIRAYSTATDASAGIWDFSSVTEIALSANFIREIANQEPAMPDATKRPRFIVVPDTLGFGLARMFEIIGEPTRPRLEVVHTMDEALAALGVQPPPTSNLWSDRKFSTQRFFPSRPNLPKAVH